VDKASVFKNGGGRRSFGVNGEVGEEAAFGVREGAGCQMEGRKCDQRIAEAAQPINKDPFCRASHGLTLVCLVLSVRASGGGH